MSAEVRREAVIHALPETVFRLLTEPALFAAWWGERSRIQPEPGGEVYIRYPNGASASGEVREIQAPERIVFTFGYDSGKPFGPSETMVTIEVAAHPDGALLRLVHELPNADLRDMHLPGWRYQMAVFARVAAAEQHADAEARVDAWLAAWNDADAEALAAVATETVEYRDDWGLTRGRDELLRHIHAAKGHLGWQAVERRGGVRRGQGTAAVEIVVINRDDQPGFSGLLLFRFAPDGRIDQVTVLA